MHLTYLRKREPGAQQSVLAYNLGYKNALLWLVATAIFLLITWSGHRIAVTAQARSAIEPWLPQRVADAEQDFYASDTLNTEFIERTNQEIAADLQGSICSMQLDTLNQTRAPRLWLWSKRFNLHWQFGSREYNALGTASCNFPWLKNTTWSGLLALPLVLFMAFYPRPLTPLQKRWHAIFVADQPLFWQAYHRARNISGLADFQLATLERMNALAIVSPTLTANYFLFPEVRALTPEQLEWFVLTLKQSPGEFELALAVAQADPELIFDIAKRQLRIHGLPINLTKTPYCYYLWYAKRRLLGIEDGWITNPPSHRPERKDVDEIAHLMALCQGHAKAINELNNHGLRAKTLDQNRNKIKEELVQILGEYRAQDYLFTSQKDLASGRGRYRLALAASNIQICSETLLAVESIT